MEKRILFFILLMICFFPKALLSEEIELNINDVIQEALSNNLSIKIDRFSPKIAKEQVTASEAVFDHNLELTGSTSKKDSQSSPQDISSNTLNTGVALNKKFQYGTTVTADVSASKTEMDDFDDEYSDTAKLQLTQPLFKNRGKIVNTKDIVTSRNNLKISELSFKQTVIDIVAQSQTLYWYLYRAIQKLTVSQKSLDLARKLLEESQTKVKIGDLAPIEILQSEAEVASREEDVIVDENEIQNAQDELINYIFGGLKNQSKIKLLQNPDYKQINLDEEKLIGLSFEKKTGYLIEKLNIENAEIDLIYKKNQTLPLVDLTATMSLNGINNTSNSAYEDMVSGDYYDATLKFTIAFPWGFRQDKANYQAAFYEKEKRLASFVQVEQQIILDVRTAIRNLVTADKRYKVTTLAEKLSMEKLNIEEDKFRTGLSTSYNVLQFQRDLTNAAVNKINAVVDYQLNLINLNKAVGITLEKNNINIKEP